MCSYYILPEHYAVAWLAEVFYKYTNICRHILQWPAESDPTKEYSEANLIRPVKIQWHNWRMLQWSGSSRSRIPWCWTHGICSYTSQLGRVSHQRSISGKSQFRWIGEFLTNKYTQATLHSYDVTGHYPDLLDIPNRDMQTSPTASNTTATSTFTHKVNNVTSNSQQYPSPHWPLDVGVKLL